MRTTRVMGKVLLLTALFSGIAWLSARDAGALEQKMHSFEVGPVISYRTYEETDIEEKGLMYGAEGAYTYRGNVGDLIDHVMFKIDGRLAYGQVDYDGQLTDGTPYKIDNINDYMGEARVTAGYDFGMGEDLVLTPYAGFGYRYLNDDSTNDPAGYEREANYYYTPVGAEIKTALNDKWSLGLKTEYDLFLWGVQKSHLSDAIPSLSDVENDQDSGYGVRGSILLEKKGETLDWIFEPFIQYWNIDESDTANVSLSGTVIGEAFEPANTTIEYGIKVAAKF